VQSAGRRLALGLPAKNTVSESCPLDDVRLKAGFLDEVSDPARGTDTTRGHAKEGHCEPNKARDCVHS
jgi:hypothetical protein